MMCSVHSPVGWMAQAESESLAPDRPAANLATGTRNGEHDT